MRRCTHTSEGKEKKIAKKAVVVHTPPIEQSDGFELTWLNPDEAQLPIFLIEKTKSS